MLEEKKVVETVCQYLSNPVAIPILVEATTALLIEMLSPYSLEGAKTTWCADVAYKSNTHHWGSLHNGNCLHNFFFVSLCKMDISALKCAQLKKKRKKKAKCLHLLLNDAWRSCWLRSHIPHFYCKPFQANQHGTKRQQCHI